MKLEIKNFRKIKEAHLDIDGITVITGSNNSGKSTIGKVLYSIFNSLYNIDKNIKERRSYEIQSICEQAIPNSLMFGKSDEMSVSHFSLISKNGASSELVKMILEVPNELFSENSLEKIFLLYYQKQGIELQEDILQEMIDMSFERIRARKEVSNQKFASELVERFFKQIFLGKMNCLNEANTLAELELQIKEKKLTIQFKENKCSFLVSELNILHEAFFIDDPFIIDYLSSPYAMFVSQLNAVHGKIMERILESRSNIMDGIFDAVDAKKNLEQIEEVLNKVTDGHISLKNGEWVLEVENFSEPIPLGNLSAGLKSFIILKILLERGILKEKDVLILDEPEIHLHPEWQVQYAEIVVLLQKIFELSIVVTTHSPLFLESLEYYSKKYKIEDKCNYYLAKDDNNIVNFENVTDKIEEIYKQMVMPSVNLDKLKYEMECEEDE